MHKCQEVEEKLLDIAFAEDVMTADIAACAHCQTELTAIRQTLFRYDEAVTQSEPAEAYWQAYKAKLLQNFKPLPAPKTEPAPGFWRKIFFSSIRVPVPVAAGVMVLFSVFTALMINALNKSKESTTVAPVVITESPKTEPLVEKPDEKVQAFQTIVQPAEPRVIVKEVPVIKERIVYRDRIVQQKVYVARETRRRTETVDKSAQTANQIDVSFTGMNSLNLADFQPTKNLAPRVVKGDDDEK
jgi:hypothetical protein